MNLVIRRTLTFLAVLLLLPAMALAIPKKGEPAPPFKVTTTSGQQVSLNNYKGYVLVLDFFATWCPPCKASIPHLVGLNKKYGKQGLQILGMSVDDDGEGEIKRFIPEKGINYPVALVDSEIQGDYGIRSIPTMYLVNKKGIIVDKYMGFSDETGQAMETAIKRLLAE
ncbi:MAG: TlpA family protein disulfide reductase [Geobacter sp.]|nr:TlpA family protein disulfide reductase [Geobacter sp.]